jgi:hypothetical protein
MASASPPRYHPGMNENILALCMILAATVCGGFGGWWCYLHSARHDAFMAQLPKRGKHHENLFKPEYDRIKAIPSHFNDHAGWLAMARAVMV